MNQAVQILSSLHTNPYSHWVKPNCIRQYIPFRFALIKHSMASATQSHLIARDTFVKAVCDDWSVTGSTDQSWWDDRAEELLNYVREHKGTGKANGLYVVKDHTEVYNERVADIISHMNALHGLQLMQFHWEIRCGNDVTRMNAVSAKKTKAELKFKCKGFEMTFGTENNDTFYATVSDFGTLERPFRKSFHTMYFKVTAVQYAGLRRIMINVKPLSARDVDDADTFNRFVEYVEANGLVADRTKRSVFAGPLVSIFCSAGYFFGTIPIAPLLATDVTRAGGRSW